MTLYLEVGSLRKQLKLNEVIRMGSSTRTGVLARRGSDTRKSVNSEDRPCELGLEGWVGVYGWTRQAKCPSKRSRV